MNLKMTEFNKVGNIYKKKNLFKIKQNQIENPL